MAFGPDFFRPALVAAFLLIGAACPGLGQPQAATADTVLGALFRGEIAADRFTPEFLRDVPFVEVERLVDGLVQEHGALVGVRPRGDGRYTLDLERATVAARIALDGEGRIAGLFLEPPVVATSIDVAVETIAALPGSASVVVTSDGAERAAHAADKPLAVGSAMKLAILKALADRVDAGAAAWTDVVMLAERHRSLPTGRLQDWPAGTPLTLAVAAGLMISESDNTATDLLLDVVGAAAVERVSPRNAPFLSTADAFRLKRRDAAALRARFTAAGAATRQSMLGEVRALALPAPGELETAPTIEVEWFLSVRELCALMEGVAELPAFAISSGPVEAGDWAEVAYKGGSEVGVLNLTARLVGADGRRHCVSATWNDAATLDDARLVFSFRALLARLAAGGG